MRQKLWEIQPGEKKTGFLKAGDSGYELPVTVICGGEGKTALVTAGIHNAEYVGIQAAMELARELQPEMLQGTVVIVPLVNVSGFSRRTMSMVYEDGKNLNREFPGRADGTAAEQICHAVSAELLERADYYIDLHSGDGYEEMHPYAYYVGPVEAQVRELSFQMARRVRVNYLVESQCTTKGAYNYASASGIPSVLIERGGLGVWSREEVDLDKEDVRRILAFLEILKEKPEEPQAAGEQLVFRQVIYEHAPETGCWYPACHAGDFFQKRRNSRRNPGLFRKHGLQLQSPGRRHDSLSDRQPGSFEGRPHDSLRSSAGTEENGRRDFAGIEPGLRNYIPQGGL